MTRKSATAAALLLGLMVVAPAWAQDCERNPITHRGYVCWGDNGATFIDPHPNGRGYTIDGPDTWAEIRPNRRGGYDVDTLQGRTPLIVPLPPREEDD